MDQQNTSSASRFERAVLLVMLLWLAVLVAAFLFGCDADAERSAARAGLHDARQPVAMGTRI